MDDNLERLQKYLAECGIGSRRACEKLIADGKIKVNNAIVTEQGIRIDSLNDIVEYNGVRVGKTDKLVYIVLNKPKGYVTTVKDQFNRPSVMDLVKIEERIYPVGRLDYDSSGLIILTNDGEFANRVMHPKNRIPKTYLAKISGYPSKETIEKFKTGVEIDGYVTARAKFDTVRPGNEFSLVKIVIYEGKNRQIRRMCETLGHTVKDLKRIGVGKLELGTLPLGKYQELDKNEVEQIFK